MAPNRLPPAEQWLCGEEIGKEMREIRFREKCREKSVMEI